MAKRPKSFWIGPAVTGSLTAATMPERRAPRAPTRAQPMRSWEREADGIIASRLAEIAARLGTPRARGFGHSEPRVPGGSSAPVGPSDLAEAFGAITSPAVRRRVLDLTRQIADAD